MDLAFSYAGFFFKQLSEIIERYKRLFGQGDNETEQESTKGTKPTFVEYWGWYYTLDNISGNDRTKWEYFLNMNVIEFLNTLAYYKDKQGYIEEQLEQQRRGSM
jgi:hypothetical protein